MTIKILFGHRKENYEGEYAPEVLEAIDEYSNDDNPDWFLKRCEGYERDESFNVLKVVEIEVKDLDIMRVLYPIKRAVRGRVKNGNEES